VTLILILRKVFESNNMRKSRSQAHNVNADPVGSRSKKRIGIPEEGYQEPRGPKPIYGLPPKFQNNQSNSTGNSKFFE